MEKSYSVNEIMDSILVKTILKNLFKNQKTEFIQRSASFIIRLKNEPENKIFRVIILPPHGFTANRINETTPHPEVRKAKIEIKGAIKLNKLGFSLLENIIKFQYYTVRNVKITEDEPYPKIGGQNYREEIKSSKQKFFVVKENGTGFYHSLVNISDKWLLLILEKELRLQRIPNLQLKMRALNRSQQKTLTALYNKILLFGDIIFEKEKKLIEKVYKIDTNKITPLLIEMLNVLETGKHESCTVYAIILKLGKTNKKVVDHLKEAIKNKTAPEYYLKELIKKLAE